jgi:hypothetical protein
MRRPSKRGHGVASGFHKTPIKSKWFFALGGLQKTTHFSTYPQMEKGAVTKKTNK